MFGEEATVSCGDISVYLPQVVTIQYSLYKGDTDLSNVSVKVYFNMSYVLNVCFFSDSRMVRKESGSNKTSAPISSKLKRR